MSKFRTRLLRTLLSAGVTGTIVAACSPVAAKPIAGTTGQTVAAPTQSAAPKSRAEVGPPASADPVLVEEGYAGYNIVRYNDRLYALPQAAGPFAEDASAQTYLQGDTQEGLHREIESAVIPTREQDADASSDTPALIWESYHLFNVVRFRHRTYALRRDGNPFDPTSADAGKYLVADTFALLKDAITTRATVELEAVADETPTTPMLVDSDVSGYNLIRFGRRTYAILGDGQEFDVQRFDRGEYARAKVGGSATEVRAQL